MRVVLAHPSRSRRKTPQSSSSERKLIPMKPISAKPPMRKPYETPVVRTLGSGLTWDDAVRKLAEVAPSPTGDASDVAVTRNSQPPRAGLTATPPAVARRRK